MTDTKRGGARSGAGRKRISSDLTRRVNISIDDDTAALYRQAGDGNLSEGFRRAATLLSDETIAALLRSARK